MLRQTINQAKKHPSLISLFVFFRARGTGAAQCVIHLALFNPGVNWSKLDSREQYKFSLVNVDCSKLKKVPTSKLLKLRAFQKPLNQEILII
ncbi:cytochrome c oxidase subunit NDUFA4-like [Psammomys obesus]|uniref:cytochrome c oxidase subunit NDUFA4-like n=1 Tax=Psammomys obesus TaxID=48139 RepID=UPI002452850B|nr:cytochrome c oxidase subunit NDUFA4-like [Psammomys obesus]